MHRFLLGVLFASLSFGAARGEVLRDTAFLLPPGSRAFLGLHEVRIPVQPPRYPVPPKVKQLLPPDLVRALQHNLDALMTAWPRAERLQKGPGDTLWLFHEDHWQGYALPALTPVRPGPPAWVAAWDRLGPHRVAVLDTAGRLWILKSLPDRPPETPPLRRFQEATNLTARQGKLWVATRRQVFRLQVSGLWGPKWQTRAPGGWLLTGSLDTAPGLLDTLGGLHLGDSAPARLPRGSSYPALLDWNQDGRADLVFLYQGHPYVRLRRPGGAFWAPDTSHRVVFPFRREFAPSVAFLSDTLGLLATPEGQVFRLHRRNGTWLPDSRPFLNLRRLLQAEGLLYPVLCADPEGTDLVVGLADGRVFRLQAPDYRSAAFLGRVPGFAAPMTLHHTWYAGDATGRVRRLDTGEPLALTPPPDSGSVFPAAADLTGDGIPELLVGQQKGGVRVYRRQGDTLWVQMARFVTPEMAVPAVLPGDSLLVAVATLGGQVYAYRPVQQDTSLRFVERNSWHFQPQRGVRDLAAYYERSYLSPAGMELRLPTDTLWAYARLLERTPQPLLDEVAFSLAHTPPEILRVLARLNQEDLFLENARGVYRADSALAYATLVDLPDGRTTIAYTDGDTLPPDLYGWYVVHPRILYEVPYRVDASWWQRPPADYGLSRDDWLRHEEDVYAHPDQGAFWRTLFQHDSTYGRTALDAVASARTLREAVRRLYLFQGWNTGGFMSFGYRTQDLQPVVIYRKAYGSCGEQSILFAALARTALIPTYVAIDMGEDHQWNEFWCCGTWHHLDVNNDTLKGIDHPATSVMKKTITAVVGWRPDDSLLVITGRYVDTASVDFVVQDSAGRPVPGALVVLRSHWRRRGMRALWGYADARGRAHLPVGYQPPLGNMVEILSPVGTAGVDHVLHHPGRRYREGFRVPGKVPPEPSPSPGELQIRSRALLWVHNPITSRPYRISSETLRRAGYEGTLYQPIVPGEWNPRVTASEGGWLLENPHPYLTLRVRARMPLPVPPEGPTARLSLNPTEGPTGTAFPYEVHLQAPAGLASAELLLWHQDSVVRRIPLEPVAEEATPWRVLRASVRDSLDTGAGGPLRPGTYRLAVRATDLAGRTTTSDTLRLHLLPTSRYLHQWVFQDQPHASEPSASWILEFWVREPLRLLYVVSEAPGAEGLDLDLFLYRDQDGDGRPSKKETVASSTSPTNHEVLLVHFPEPGHYWLYAQGCTVENPPQPFNLTCSFVVDSLGAAHDTPLVPEQ